MRWNLGDTYEDEMCPVVTIITERSRSAPSLIQTRDAGVSIVENTSEYNKPRPEYPGDPGTPALFYPSGAYVGNVPSGQLVVTDQWVSGIPGVEFTPLFYQYQLKYDVFAASPADNVVLTNDQGEAIDRRRYRVQVGDMALAPSGTTGRYSPTVAWTNAVSPSGYHRTRLLLPDDVLGTPHHVKYRKWVHSTDTWQEEWVNPKPLYLEGPDWQQNEDTHSIVITGGNLTGTTEIMVTRAVGRNVEVLPPIGDPEVAWRPRVSVGHFAKSDPGSITDATLYVVPIPANRYEENFTQNDTLRAPARPAEKIRQERVTFRERNVIQLQRTPVIIHASGVVTDRDASLEPLVNEGYPWYVPYPLRDIGQGERHRPGGTPSGVTIYEGNTPLPPEDVVDWNEEHGLIKLRQTFGEQSQVYATYLHELRDVEIDSLDMNPRIDTNPFASGGIRVVLTPDYLGWHAIGNNPSGVYEAGSVMNDRLHPKVNRITQNTDAQIDMNEIRESTPTTVISVEPSGLVGRIAGDDEACCILSYPDLIGNSNTQVPSGAQVLSAWLTLSASGIVGNAGEVIGEGDIVLYRMLRNWNRDEVTWNIYSTGNEWTEPGSGGRGTDVEAEEMARQDGKGNTTDHTSYHFNVASGVQAWTDGTANYGWLITGSGTAESIIGTSLLIGSDESETPGEIPSLSVVYSLGGVVSSASGVAIGDYYLNAIRPDEVTLIDTRRLGGGLKPKVLERQDEKDYYVVRR